MRELLTSTVIKCGALSILLGYAPDDRPDNTSINAHFDGGAHSVSEFLGS